MNTTELKTFISVSQHASISKAAEELHLTQPAVTKRIQALEQRLGSALFDRIGKRLHLTQAGHLLEHQAREILLQWADTERQLRALTEEVTGTLTLATSHHIGLHRLAPVLKSFTAEFPDVHLDLTFEDSEIAHEQVRQGEVELAVATLDPDGAEDLSTKTIWDDPLVFVDIEPGTFELHELADRPCVLPGTGTYTGRIVLERFLKSGITLTPTMSTNFLETLSMLVSVGLGWSVLPAGMARDVAQIQVPGSNLRRTLGAIINPHRAMSNAAQAFLNTLDKYADASLPAYPT